MAEANAVAAVVEALALSRPEVGFSLRSNGRGVLALPAAADLRERISQVHGLPLARGLVALDDNPRLAEMPEEEVARQLVLGGYVEGEPSPPLVAEALQAVEDEEGSAT